MLEFDAVTKRFGPVAALDRCTFAARPGRLTGFLGPNGAGKTTAMRAVFGLVELDAGTVRWRGAPVCAAERARFGYMPEERGLYPRMRVRDQLVYLGQLCGREAEDVARSVDAWLERLGLAERAADRLDALSHGNQQRVQLIAALVNEPDLLVLDEPFSGLDPIAIGAMAELLAEPGGGGRDGAVLQPPARPRRGPVRGRRHHRPRPDRAGRRAGGAAGRGAAAVRRHPVPGPGAGLVRGWPRPRSSRRKTARPGCGSAATPTWPRWWRRSGTAPTSSRSATSRRRCRSCSVRRWRHERRAAGLAGRAAGDARAEPVPRLPGISRRDDRGRGRRDHPARAAQARQHQGRRPHRFRPRRAGGHHRRAGPGRRDHGPRPPLRQPRRRRAGRPPGRPRRARRRRAAAGVERQGRRAAQGRRDRRHPAGRGPRAGRRRGHQPRRPGRPARAGARHQRRTRLGRRAAAPTTRPPSWS